MKKFLKGFVFALRGIKSAYRSEINFRFHLIVTIIIVLAGYIFNISAIAWIAQSLAIGLVLGFELINTAIEELTDMVSPEYNHMAGKIKDLAAGAVLIVSFFAMVTGLIIYLPKILELF